MFAGNPICCQLALLECNQAMVDTDRRYCHDLQAGRQGPSVRVITTAVVHAEEPCMHGDESTIMRVATKTC